MNSLMIRMLEIVSASRGSPDEWAAVEPGAGNRRLWNCTGVGLSPGADLPRHRERLVGEVEAPLAAKVAFDAIGDQLDPQGCVGRRGQCEAMHARGCVADLVDGVDEMVLFERIIPSWARREAEIEGSGDDPERGPRGVERPRRGAHLFNERLVRRMESDRAADFVSSPRAYARTSRSSQIRSASAPAGWVSPSASKARR